MRELPHLCGCVSVIDYSLLHQPKHRNFWFNENNNLTESERNLQWFLSVEPVEIDLIKKIIETTLMGGNPYNLFPERCSCCRRISTLFNELHVFSFRNHKVFHLFFFLLPHPFPCVIIIFDIWKKGEHCMRKQFNGLKNLLNWKWSVENLREDSTERS